MHSPRPYGKAVNGTPPTEADSAEMDAWVRRLTNLKATYGVDSLRLVRPLQGGGFAVAQDMGGVFKVLCYKPEAEPDRAPMHEGLATSYVPMLFCGKVSRTPAPAERPLEVTLTAKTRERLRAYSENNPAVPGVVSLARFNCRLPSHLVDFSLWFEQEDLEHQAFQVRPTWWSGAMAEVIQVVGGYGRQKFDELPDTPLERARFLLPQRVKVKIELELNNVRLPGYVGVPHDDGHFQYDFHRDTTHGVTFDSVGKPWLTQVNERGVYTMPLPMIPATTTAAFRAYVEEKQDTELLAILERFGGLPSGEKFPDGAAFEAWRRAGVVIKVCETREFYALDAINTAAGWSFNKDGTEGFCTAVGQDSPNQLPFCAAFKLRLRFGPAENAGLLPLFSMAMPPEQRAKINTYLSRLYEQLTANKDRERAIKYKIRRVAAEGILDRAHRDGASDVDYWDNLELPPIAQHSGNCARVGKGFVPLVIPNFKLPEPAGGGLLSWDLRSIYEVNANEEPPKMDTVLFGYYQGDELKTVKYFYEPAPLPKEKDGNFEDVMPVGQWEETVYNSPMHIAGNLYTSDFDEREEIASDYTHTTIKGIDLGYQSRPDLVFFYYFWRPAEVTRSRYFGRVTKVRQIKNQRKSVYAYVPFMQRNMLVYGSKTQADTVKVSESAKRHEVADPNYYLAWTYDWVWHWAAYDMDTSWMDSPMPHQYNPPNPTWAEEHFYKQGDGYSDWADSGPFLGALPADLSWIYRISNISVTRTAPTPTYNEYSWSKPPEPVDPSYVSYADTPGLTKKISTKEVSYQVFSLSPDPQFQTVFYADACALVLGQRTYGNVSAKDDEGQPVRWGYTRLANTHGSSHHFIGVINE